MKVGISGASGQLGKAILADIVARHPNVDLVGISRTANSLETGIENRSGDYDWPDTLKSATRGSTDWCSSPARICARVSEPLSTSPRSMPRWPQA